MRARSKISCVPLLLNSQSLFFDAVIKVHPRFSLKSLPSPLSAVCQYHYEFFVLFDVVVRLSAVFANSQTTQIAQKMSLAFFFVM